VMELNVDIKRLPPAQERPRGQENWSKILVCFQSNFRSKSWNLIIG
jgi:hypothetical protein